MSRHVCIVSPGSLATNPRVLKEAGALHDAGYRVTTITCDYAKALRDADDGLIATVPWTVIRVPRARGERFVSALWHLVARVLARLRLPIPLPVAATAYGGPASALHAAAWSVKADLYIAHYIPALPAAAAAARRHGGKLGFDAEDFHSGEGGEGEAEAFRMALVRRIEGALIPECSLLTAASPMIARAYEAAYGVSATAILNVFPLAMAPDETPKENAPTSSQLRAYWFSQTIGLDRGLQSFIEAMSKCRTTVTLDVRGNDRWGHGDTLLALARDHDIRDRLRLLPLAAPADMARLAGDYDLGLSLETEVTESRRMCLTNKIFTYLLAGIPTMLSDTPAQTELARELGSAAILVSLADPEGMAAALDRLAAPTALQEAKSASSRLGRTRYNWEMEKMVLLDAMASVFRNHATDPS